MSENRISLDGLVHDAQRLKELQALPLERKIQITQARIIEFVERMGGVENVVVSYSGGKDSTVLLDIARKIYPNIKAVYSNTGLEYPEVQHMARINNAEFVHPKMRFDQVITTYGYPLISKEVSEAIYIARKHRIDVSERSYNYIGKKREELMGVQTYIGANGEEKKSCFNKDKWLPFVDLPIRISNYCCSAMKKLPIKAYKHEHRVVDILGTMAEESRLRKQGWIKTGCNAFNGDRSKSTPMAFWTEQDVLCYIVKKHIPIASVYGDIIAINPSGFIYDMDYPELIIDDAVVYRTTGASRTGCIFCAYGQHLTKEGEGNFERLKTTHPKQYSYAVNGGQWIDNPAYMEELPEYDGAWKNWNPEKIWVPSKEGLGFGKVFDMVNEAYGEEIYRY